MFDTNLGFWVIFCPPAAFYHKKIFYWSPAFRICMGCLPKYQRNLLKIGFNNTYFQVFQGFPTLKEAVAHIQPNGQFWTVFGQNWRNRIFLKKVFRTFFSLLKALNNCKVSEKSNEWFSRNISGAYPRST